MLFDNSIQKFYSQPMESLAAGADAQKTDWRVYMPYAEGQPVRYNPNLHLPPDIASEVLGRRELTEMVEHYRYMNGDDAAPVRLLVPGVGSGILACSFIAGLEADPHKPSYATPRNVHIDAFDVEPQAVTIARENIGRHIQSRWGEQAPVTFNVFEGDWSSDTTWQDLQDRQAYTHIIVNPPCLATGDSYTEWIRRGYEGTPRTALDGGEYGTTHYEAIAKNLPSVLLRQPGAGILVRFPVIGLRAANSLHNYSLLSAHNQGNPFQKIMTAPFETEGDPFIERTTFDDLWVNVRKQDQGQWIDGWECTRGLRWGFVQRASASMPAYLDKRVRTAVRFGLPYIPTEGEVEDIKRFVL